MAGTLTCAGASSGESTSRAVYALVACIPDGPRTLDAAGVDWTGGLAAASCPSTPPCVTVPGPCGCGITACLTPPEPTGATVLAVAALSGRLVIDPATGTVRAERGRLVAAAGPLPGVRQLPGEQALLRAYPPSPAAAPPPGGTPTPVLQDAPAQAGASSSLRPLIGLGAVVTAEAVLGAAVLSHIHAPGPVTAGYLAVVAAIGAAGAFGATR